MAKTEDKYNRRRLKTSYIASIVSITLVLFMLGLLSILIYHARLVGNYVKENIGFTAIIKDGVPESRILELKSSFDAKPWVKATRYVTKEEAAKTLMKDLGEDFVSFLGYNPLLPSIDIRLKAVYANNDSILPIERQILANTEIKEIVYQKSLVNVVNENVRRISMIFLGFGILLLAISIALINNTIRLAIYSKRFLIKTMQLVGATETFIRRPFLLTGLMHGIYSSIITLILLAGTLYLVYQQVPELINIRDFKLYLTLLSIVTLLGVVISWISTYFAVRKFLRTRSEYLY